MKVLQEIQNNFILLNFCPSNSMNVILKIRNLIFSVSCLIGMIVYVLTSGAYIKRNLMENFEGCLLAVMTCTGALGLVYMMIVAYVLRYKIVDIFYDFQDIYEQYEILDSGKFMQKANERSAQTVKYGMYFILLCCVTAAIMMIISLFRSFLKFGYANIEILYRPLNLLLPWDQNCLLGWIGEEFLTTIMVAMSVIVALTFLALFISFLFFNLAFYQIYRTQFEKIDLLPQSTQFHGYVVKKLLLESISFHISAKKLFKKTAHIYGSLILIFLANMIVMLATSIFQMDFAFRHPDLTIFLMFYAFLYGLAQLYAYCYVGKYSTDNFLAFADCLYESNWMALPSTLRGSFPLMIAHAQRPLYYHGFHMIILDLKLFLTMMKTVGSYYLMFKAFVDV